MVTCSAVEAGASEGVAEGCCGVVFLVGVGEGCVVLGVSVGVVVFSGGVLVWVGGVMASCTRLRVRVKSGLFVLNPFCSCTKARRETEASLTLTASWATRANTSWGMSVMIMSEEACAMLS